MGPARCRYFAGLTSDGYVRHDPSGVQARSTEQRNRPTEAKGSGGATDAGQSEGRSHGADDEGACGRKGTANAGRQHRDRRPANTRSHRIALAGEQCPELSTI